MKLVKCGCTKCGKVCNFDGVDFLLSVEVFMNSDNNISEFLCDGCVDAFLEEHKDQNALDHGLREVHVDATSGHTHIKH